MKRGGKKTLHIWTKSISFQPPTPSVNPVIISLGSKTGLSVAKKRKTGQNRINTSKIKIGVTHAGLCREMSKSNF